MRVYKNRWMEPNDMHSFRFNREWFNIIKLTEYLIFIYLYTHQTDNIASI